MPRSIVVIGAGPAGLMAAIRAEELKARVVVIEKNALAGRKLLLSGKGRCNLTNASPLDLFLPRFSRNGQFLRDAFKKFFNTDLMRFFEKRGLALKVERQERVFPVTDRSSSILEVLIQELKERSIEIAYKSGVDRILIKNKAVSGVALKDGRIFSADKVILATGGASYAFTGSSGDGFAFARSLGHHVEPLRPGLVPLVTSQKYVRMIKGLVLRSIRLTFSDGKKEIVSDIGELLFTDFGISGPLVLTLSGEIADWLMQGKQVSVLIDLKPGLSEEQVDLRLLREFKLHAKRSLKNVARLFLPVNFVDIFLEAAKIDSGKSVSQITQKERQVLSSMLKGFRMEIVKTLPLEEAMVTRGGVSLKEINPRTMESRLVSGLYFAGEVLDIDADTGGFNLQAAFSTGYLAGESAALS